MVKDYNIEDNKLFSNVSILVVGYDGYQDVWEHFAYFINKYWPNRPKTYLATSELSHNFQDITTIPAGKNSEWSKRASNALKYIKTDYVLLLLEDFFITDYVNNYEFLKILKYIKDRDIKFYQLKTPKLFKCFIEGKQSKENKYIWAINRNCKYGLNLQAAIWNTDFLREAIGDENYNAWTFECKYLDKTDYNEKKVEYVIDDRDLLHITHSIIQSKYVHKAIKKCIDLGYKINTERKILDKRTYYIYQLKQIICDLLPKRLSKPIKWLARHLGFSFVTDKYMETKA